MGVLRLDLNWDYDHWQEQVNNHKTIRPMLGHAERFDTHYYQLQTLKDNVPFLINHSRYNVPYLINHSRYNVRLLSPTLLDKINQIVVTSGHALVKKKGSAVLRGRCDSFVVETNVHYPTDINLLLDAMRKVSILTARRSEAHDLSTWRQHAYTVRQIKRIMRIAQMKKRGGGETETQKAKRQRPVVEVHQRYITVAQPYLETARISLNDVQSKGLVSSVPGLTALGIQQFMAHAERQIEQIKRQVIKGETIPHHEKVFSLFEPHTEWIVKGKAGVPVELGLRVCVREESVSIFTAP